MSFVKITNADVYAGGAPVAEAWVNSDLIGYFYTEESVTTLLLKNQRKTWFECRESSEELLRAIPDPIELGELL